MIKFETIFKFLTLERVSGTITLLRIDTPHPSLFLKVNWGGLVFVRLFTTLG